MGTQKKLTEEQPQKNSNEAPEHPGRLPCPIFFLSFPTTLNPPAHPSTLHTSTPRTAPDTITQPEVP